MKQIGIIICWLMLVCFVKNTNAQLPWFSNFNNNVIALNPAFTGNEYHLSVRGQYKTMWTEIINPPSTSLISAHAPIGISNSSIGGIITHDNFGVITTNNLSINYAYRFQTQIGRIAAGILLNVQDYREQLTATHPTTPNDPALATDYSAMFFNGGLGIAWESENGFFGIAVPAILTPTRNETNDSIALTTPQLNLNGAYKFVLSPNWELTSSLYYGYINTLPSQMALMFDFTWKNNYAFLAGIRTNNAYTAGFTYTFLDNFKIGYTYDYFDNNLGAAAGGGHELVIGFDLNKPEGE